MMGLVTGFFSGLLLLAGGPGSQEDPKKAEADDAVRKFSAEFGAAGAGEAEKVRAVQHLTRVLHRKTMFSLGSLLADPSMLVSVAAAEGLSKFQEVKGAVNVLLSGIEWNKKRPDVRKVILKALGDLQEEGALPTLHGLVSLKPYDAAKEAVVAVGKIRSKPSIPHLIDLLKKVEKPADSQNAETGVPGVPYVPGGPTVPGANTPNLPQLPDVGGYGAGVGGDDSRAQQEERRRMLQEPLNQALSSITKEKYTTGKEWELWWQKRGAAFKVEK